MFDFIPPIYRDAEADLPAVDQWCATVLAGGSARLLLLGPFMSGKTYTGYAAVRRLLVAGYPRSNIAAYSAYELARKYHPSAIADGPPVIFLDNLTDRSDNNAGVKIVHPDEPEIQAMMAAEQGAVVDAAERLTARANVSWIACASNLDRLRHDLGDEVADRLLAVADAIELPRRPKRGPILDW